MGVRTLLLAGLVLLLPTLAGAMELRSAAFAPNGTIPAIYSCQGEDFSPPLTWDGVPPGTASLVLTMASPDAPAGSASHWLLYNLPAEQRQLPGGLIKLPAGSGVGRNSWGRAAYSGPCPEGGSHRYDFHLFALDRRLHFTAWPDREQLQQAMSGLILEQADLSGRYRKQ